VVLWDLGVFGRMTAIAEKTAQVDGVLQNPRCLS
jgi:hypothetical protein